MKIEAKARLLASDQVHSDEAFDKIKAAGGTNVTTTSGSIRYYHHGAPRSIKHTEDADGNRWVDGSELAKQLNELKAQLQAGRSQAWFDELPPKDQAKYLNEHPNSSFGNNHQKQRLAPVPKSGDLYERGGDFSDETNDRAKRSADKEVQDTKERNRKISEENKKGQGLRKELRKDLRETQPKDYGKSLSKQMGPRFTTDYLAKNKATPKETVDRLVKSPTSMANFISNLYNHVAFKQDLKGPEKKAAAAELLNLRKNGSKEDHAEFIKNFFGQS